LAFDFIVEVTSREVLKEQFERVFRLVDIDKFDDVGVIQFPHDGDLSFDTFIV
jgi:hypothetical protein